MPTITPAELNTLRSQRPNTAQVRWYAALAPYSVRCFTATINEPGISPGAMQFSFNNGVGVTNVHPGMTLWVGSEYGACDLGKVRVRNIAPGPAGTGIMYVAENDDVAWANGVYLTCPGEEGFYELWAKLPRITETGGVVTFYEDYDVAFVPALDQYIPPKANAGPPVCVFLNEDGYVDVEFTGDRSFTTEAGATLTYSWDFRDGVVVGGSQYAAGTCANPNIVRFTAPGFRYVCLTVTDSTAGHRTGYVRVPVWVFNRPETGGVHVPLRIHPVSQESRPHWLCVIRAFDTNSTDITERFYGFPDGALVVVFTETVYPDGSTDIGGFCNRENIRFVGWLNGESLVFDYDSGTCEFEAVSHDQILQSLPGFGFTLEDSATPTDWYMVNDMNVDRAALALLQRRTTACEVIHLETPGEGNARPISVQVYPEANVYTQIDEYLLKDAHCRALTDRQGILRMTRDPQFLSAAARNFVDVVCTLENRDRLDSLTQLKRHGSSVGHVRIGGFSYETPILAQAPGDAWVRGPGEYYKEGFIFRDANEATLWAWCELARLNNPFPEVELALVGNWPVFDPAFQEYVKLTMEDPLSRNNWVGERFIVREVTFLEDVEAGTSVTRLKVEKETDLGAGELTPIPPPPRPEDPPPPPPFNPEPVPLPTVAIIHDRQHIYRTLDLHNLNPTWTDITHPDMENIFAVEMDQYVDMAAWALTGSWGVESNDQSWTQGLWYTPDITAGPGAWSLVLSQGIAAGSYTFWSWCTNRNLETHWGQLRSLVSYGPNECLVAEAKWVGLAWQAGSAGMRCSSRILKVSVNGGTTVTPFNNSVNGMPWVSSSIGTWEQGCLYCPPGSPAFGDLQMPNRAHWCLQYDLKSCHQLLRSSWTEEVPMAIGGYMLARRDGTNICAGLENQECLPWPRPVYGPGLDFDHRNTRYHGARHAVIWNGGGWGILEDSPSGAGWGALYSEAGYIHNETVYRGYGFCNMCTLWDDLWLCTYHPGLDNDTNELIRGTLGGFDYTEITGHLLFGSTPVGMASGRIGHIRGIWGDKDREETLIAIVRKTPFSVLAQDELNVIWLYDTETGNLYNKTGVLDDGMGGTRPWSWMGGEVDSDWVGTGVHENSYNYRWDNVGFSAPGVPLR